MTPGASPFRLRQQGFALLLMLVLLTMGLLFTLVSQLSLVGMKVGRAQGTNAALLQAKEALIGYAATYRDANPGQVFGFLPCPDTAAKTGGQTPGDGSAAVSCGIAGETVVGLLPYKTLGLADLRDSGGVCLWYVVSGNFKNNPSSTPLNWDTQGNIKVLDINGNTLAQPDDPNGGASAVIIAAGQPRTGQNRTLSAQSCGVDPAEITAYLEGVPALPASGTVTLTQGSGEGSNNDQMLTITPREIFAKIVARGDFHNPLTAAPPGQINTLADRIRASLEPQIWNDIKNGTPHPAPLQPSNQAGYTQAAGRYIGELPGGLSTGSSDFDNYLSHWGDQFRYSLCTGLSAACLTINGDNCYGAVLFGAQSITGGPRPSALKPPPTGTNNYTSLLANYFESGLSLLDGSSAVFAGNSSYAANAGNASADVATCLINKTNLLSFETDIGTLTPRSADPDYPLVSIDPGQKTIALGNLSGSSPKALAGCVWFANPVRFSTSLRVYFDFVIENAGEGFTFTLADKAQNGNTIPGCGDIGNALGYAGATVDNGILPPKIGIEFDTRRSISRTDPNSNHAAFVFWGETADNSDDNTHNAGAGTASEPLNPRSLSAPQTVAITSAQWTAGKVTVTLPAPPSPSAFRFESNEQVTIAAASPAAYNGTYRITVIDPTHFTYPLNSNPGGATTGGTATAIFSAGIQTVNGSPPYFSSTSSFPLNSTIHVRLDIQKSYTSPAGTYTMKAYVGDELGSTGQNGLPPCGVGDLQNIFQDLDEICYQLPMIEQDNIPIDDANGVEALANVYLGFTNGQSGTTGRGNELIEISNFVARSQ